ncbi:MAG: hypothetical protein HOH36_01480 [Acidimicrobiaceae bacterium]|jgi:hypothetical protein|nr:hypothetical protein [Acidimicrobiaceae bacterium]MBT5582355.1 hypothetical protein [Acidimicrobiaceae bacterium]MBT5849084.1 hypothetical protein [Acidimicrobiaceae bacterium]
MPLYQIHIHMNPAEGRCDDFERWYEDIHVDDVIRTTDGCRSGQRLWLRSSTGQASPNEHLAIYEVEADSADVVIAALNARRDDRTYVDGILDTSQIAFWVYEAAGPRHESS